MQYATAKIIPTDKVNVVAIIVGPILYGHL